MLEDNFKQDIVNIGNISIVPTLLNVICQTTGMGFAAIARVTEDRWITCSVQDNVLFGLKPGDELKIKTTICNEIRKDPKPVIIDNVSEDPHYHDHHTPAMYKLQSYISVPIIRQDGTFFGTLCAIDPKPNSLKEFRISEMFNLFALLISFHLSAIEQSVENKQVLKEKTNLLKKTVDEKKSIEKKLIEKNISLEKMNSELEAFNYISSHDLQEPLRKIQLFTDTIEREESSNLSEKGKAAFHKIKTSAFRMQNLINDLLIYSKTKFDDRKFVVKDLNIIAKDVIEDLTNEFENKNVTFDIQELGKLSIIEFQFRQLLYNLINNSLKFASPDRNLVITVSAKITNGQLEKLSPLTKYYTITIADNGIGFEPTYSEKIFGLFQALHTKPLKSTGIGLTIVKRIVENHNGFIKAEGALNQGAKFDIFIPIE
ncbi:GAF domain-containing protein [Flavobacterium psychroterrae]|uniref:histidine kinase n=1 Tax=Flavobacterium psychroterrae TaxID=2133767 RepID=A0ABS5PAG7_9FLAO|nr:ATP-binding protein [Flavobacterium psychroterrae]MBS7231269.1 GAF domain-containing protein [Flavobacterium psychroterrae]